MCLAWRFVCGCFSVCLLLCGALPVFLFAACFCLLLLLLCSRLYLLESLARAQLQRRRRRVVNIYLCSILFNIQSLLKRGRLKISRAFPTVVFACVGGATAVFVSTVSSRSLYVCVCVYFKNNEKLITVIFSEKLHPISAIFFFVYNFPQRKS